MQPWKNIKGMGHSKGIKQNGAWSKNSNICFCHAEFLAAMNNILFLERKLGASFKISLIFPNFLRL